VVLSLLAMGIIAVVYVVEHPKREFNEWLMVAAIIFSGGLVGRCILEASHRTRADAQHGAAADDRPQAGDRG